MNSDKLIAQEITSLKARAGSVKQNLARIQQHRDWIDQLPEFTNSDSAYSGPRLAVYYSTTPSRDPEELRAQVQQVLGVAKADRELDIFSGSISYILKNSYARITIYGGKIAPTCRLVEVTEIATRFKMECDEPEQQEHLYD